MIFNMAIILIGGLKHCGKSTLGRIIADDLDYQFYDMDDLVLAETAGAWKSVRAIYRDAGKDEFMRLEQDAARNFVEWHVPDLNGRGAILSLGGGTVENRGAMAWIGRKGFNVYVRAPRALLFKRIIAGGRPPFLSEDDPEGDWAALYEKRDALYAGFAALTHDVDESEPSINAQRLLVKLEESELKL